MHPLAITHFSVVNALGAGASSVASALRARRSGLAACAFETVALDTWIGQVAGLDEVRVRPDLGAYDCRNNRLAQRGLELDGYAGAVRVARAKYGAARIGVFLGTSTSGILQTELAYRRRARAEGVDDGKMADRQWLHISLTVSENPISSPLTGARKIQFPPP